MRSTYIEENGYRTYLPEYNYKYSIWGREITDDTAFDGLRIQCSPDAHVIGEAYIYNQGTRVSQVPADYVASVLAHVNTYRYRRDDPEVQIVRGKIRDGACVVRFVSVERTPNPVYTVEELHESHWLLDLSHPFHDDDRDLFLARLTATVDFTAPAAGKAARFTIPGILEGSNRRYYKRDDSAATPDVNALSELADAGWTPDIPYGPHALHAVDVLDVPGSVAVAAVQRVYHRRKDETAAIVAIARAWHRYWRNLTGAEQGINTRMTARKHWEHAIGRMWADKPNDNGISVFYGTDRTATARIARDAEDWKLGNAEQWINEWGGFTAFVLALSQGTNRALLEAQLDDYTFAHVNEDGTVGDRLSNGSDGLLQSTWDAYQSTHYPAAVNHGVDGLAIGTLTVVVPQGDTETAQLPVTGGLAPHTHELAFPPAWASIDTATGNITVDPDSTVAVEDHTLNAKVTDDLGTVATASVTVTVTAATSD